MKILFVCLMGRLRSRTAAEIYEAGGGQADYCGIEPDADQKINDHRMEWADRIVILDDKAYKKVSREWRDHSDKMIKWTLPDEFGFMDDDLIFQLKPLINDLMEYKLH